ncbi:U7 snRNA-associated Sm-like protein LSm10 isoform X1 [Phascolarctos cinereus]|uniref:U7 snRNA-associated Sm-like protein LSm10 isoform X1 n=2 Tax=Phascolarctos cinereus TaxID=38626 RepID=A0A6P5K377_PHACI|nr:U7 snRNA-associated Sm-like protein LSm10 isoform X1 [Phascolarctos cinereus]
MPNGVQSARRDEALTEEISEACAEEEGFGEPVGGRWEWEDMTPRSLGPPLPQQARAGVSRQQRRKGLAPRSLLGLVVFPLPRRSRDWVTWSRASIVPAFLWPWRPSLMEVSHSVKERTIAENSLVILLQGLRGLVTTVDLRDETVARGRVDNVDAFMNIRLAEVTYTDRQGQQVQLDDLFVTGRNVRYVHIPDDVDITTTIEQQLQAIHRVRNFGSEGKGRREFPTRKYK